MGDELKLFKSMYSGIIPPDKDKASLWTVHGSFKHAESINSQKAWNVFKSLLYTYFFQKDLNLINEFATIEDFTERLERYCNIIERFTEKVEVLFSESQKRNSRQMTNIRSIQSTDQTIASDIAKQLNLYSRANLPHCQLVGAIAKTLQMPIRTKDKYEDEDITIVPDQSNVDGFWQLYYKPGGVKRIIEWFNDNKDRITFSKYYLRDTKNNKKGDIKGYGYKINGIRYWLK